MKIENEAQAVSEARMDFGPHEYSPDDRVLIRSWLGITEPLHG